MSVLCIACQKEVDGRRHSISCDVCERWQHRLRGTVYMYIPETSQSALRVLLTRTTSQPGTTSISFRSQSSTGSKPKKLKGLEILADSPCDASFGRTMAEDQSKIDSYNFSRAAPYIDSLRPDENPEVTFKNGQQPNIEIPTIVSATSSNHFSEGLHMINNLNKFVRPAYPNIKLYVYDIGLQSTEREKFEKVSKKKDVDYVKSTSDLKTLYEFVSKQLKTLCNCTVLPFPFDRFPAHVRKINNYCWKPLMIKLMLQTKAFVMWMDTSIRFNTTDLDPLFKQAKEQGILAHHDTHLLPSHIHEDMFEFLQEPPCLYRNFGEFSASLILIYRSSQTVSDYIVKPLASCALIEHCIETKYPVEKLLDCPSHKHYHVCHRYDQAFLSLLLYRLYHDSYMDHSIDIKYFRWCRGSDCV